MKKAPSWIVVGGPDLLDDVREAQMLHNEDKRAFAVRKREYEGHGKVQRKIRFFEGTRSDRGSTVQVEIFVEVDEQVERLVRCTNLWREDGAKQRIGREVFRSVSKGTQHGWSKLLVLVGSRVQEEACPRTETAKGVSETKENKRGGHKGDSSRHKVRNNDCVWKSKFTGFCSASDCIGFVRNREYSKQQTTTLFQIEDIRKTSC